MNPLCRFSIAVLALTALSSCAPEFNPPADYKGGFLWNAGQSRTVMVQTGDTLYTVSRRYNVPTRAIISRNGLQPPYELRVGQQLILDPARTHTVQTGDTLSKIARQYGVEMRLIAEANDLQPPYVVVLGKTLWIPDPFQAAAAPVPSQADLPPVNVAVPAGSASRSTPIVKEQLAPPPGEDAFPAPQSSRPAPTGMQSQALPPPEGQTVQPLPRELNTSPETMPAEQQTAALPPPIAAEDPKPLTQPPARAAARFAWPIKGKILSGFGATGKGLHNDGINIAASAGADVRAADNGVVAYAGNELKGFGNLLLIKH
ncbi:MAG: LysM peptidoglycan-binding domain-containing protein, partial [Rhodospirillaceae bacterium]|nr:LysM peptidoglycan-binding domain-containing protein [Rhodospirillaceae bacterium]